MQEFFRFVDFVHIAVQLLCKLVVVHALSHLYILDRDDDVVLHVVHSSVILHEELIKGHVAFHDPVLHTHVSLSVIVTNNWKLGLLLRDF